MKQQTRQKGNSEMTHMNIADFLAAARHHLLGLSTAQATLTNMPAQVRRAH